MIVLKINVIIYLHIDFQSEPEGYQLAKRLLHFMKEVKG